MPQHQNLNVTNTIQVYADVVIGTTYYFQNLTNTPVHITNTDITDGGFGQLCTCHRVIPKFGDIVSISVNPNAYSLVLYLSVPKGAGLSSTVATWTEN